VIEIVDGVLQFLKDVLLVLALTRDVADEPADAGVRSPGGLMRTRTSAQSSRGADPARTDSAIVLAGGARARSARTQARTIAPMPGRDRRRASSARWYRVRISPAGGDDARIGWLVGDITREREHQENIFQELQNAIDISITRRPASLARAGRAHPLSERHARRVDPHRPSRVRAGRCQYPRHRDPSRASPSSRRQSRAGSTSETLDVDLVPPMARGSPSAHPPLPVSPDGTVGASRTLVLDMRSGDDREAGRIAEMRFARFFNNTPMAIASSDREDGSRSQRALRDALRAERRGGRALSNWCRSPTAPGSPRRSAPRSRGQSEIPAVDAGSRAS